MLVGLAREAELELTSGLAARVSTLSQWIMFSIPRMLVFCCLATIPTLPVRGSAQDARPLPVLGGYQLLTRRSSLPRDLPCMPDNTCQPSDSVTLYFGRGKTVGMIELSFGVADPSKTVLQLWEGQLSAWLRSQLGTPDSVSLSFDKESLEAFWDHSPSRAWSATAHVGNLLSPQPLIFVHAMLMCIGSDPRCLEYFGQ